MPIYEFRCAPEGHQFESFVMNSQEQVHCPECGSHQLERLMSTFASSAKGNAAPSAAPVAAAPKRGCGGGCACH